MNHNNFMFSNFQIIVAFDKTSRCSHSSSIPICCKKWHEESPQAGGHKKDAEYSMYTKTEQEG